MPFYKEHESHNFAEDAYEVQLERCEQQEDCDWINIHEFRQYVMDDTCGSVSSFRSMEAFEELFHYWLEARKKAKIND